MRQAIIEAHEAGGVIRAFVSRSRVLTRLYPAIIALVLALPVWTPPAVAELVISSGRKEPFVTPDGTGFYDLLVKALFGRLGIEARCVALPSERALLNADTGVDDGNMARIADLEARYPNLLRVPGKILDFEFMAFVADVDFNVNGWNSLVPYSIGFITGWKIFETNITHARSITLVRSPGQLFTLLDHRRADVVMFDRLGGNWWIRNHGVRAHALEPPIDVREMFLYLNKKHAALVPRVGAALEQMRADGQYQRIYDQTLAPLLGDSSLVQRNGQWTARQ